MMFFFAMLRSRAFSVIGKTTSVREDAGQNFSLDDRVAHVIVGKREGVLVREEHALFVHGFLHDRNATVISVNPERKSSESLIKRFSCCMLEYVMVQTQADNPIITCIGEALVDFIATSPGPLSHARGFVKALGGEAANVAVGLARLGSRVQFVGKVGADAFGRFVVDELKENGVETSGIVFDKKHKTRLAFVSLSKDGERDFEFWEKEPAGEQLRSSDVDFDTIAASRVVNIAPLLFMKEPARSTAFEIAEEVKRIGGVVAFDANVRLALWKSAAEARRVLLHMARRTSILRLNADEADFLTGEARVEPAAAKLRALGPDLVAITLGAKGCYIQNAACDSVVRGFKVRAVDTTGCGDAFFAALLHGIATATRPMGDLSREEFTAICRFANAVGALTALKRGGAAAIPHPKDVVKFLKQKKQW